MGLAASLGKQRLSGVLGLVVYFVILVPVLISALSAMQLEAITKPASDMLGKIMEALPNIIGAAIVVLIAVVDWEVVVRHCDKPPGRGWASTTCWSHWGWQNRRRRANKPPPRGSAWWFSP